MWPQKFLLLRPAKKNYFSVQQKNYVFAPRKKNLPPRHKNFVLRRKICAQKRAKFAAERKILFCAAKFARKNAQNRANGFAYHAAKNAELRAKKNFAPQTAQFARKQKFPKMETLLATKDSADIEQSPSCHTAVVDSAHFNGFMRPLISGKQPEMKMSLDVEKLGSLLFLTEVS